MSSVKKILLLAVIVAVVALVGPWSPWMSDQGDGREQGMPGAGESGFSVELALDRQVYDVGEPIALALVGIHRAASPVALTFASGKQYDFTVVRRGETEPVARWSAGRAFTMIVRNRELASGQPLVFSVKWTPKTEAGPLGPGEYEITGEMATTPPLRSGAVPFEIR